MSLEENNCRVQLFEGSHESWQICPRALQDPRLHLRVINDRTWCSSCHADSEALAEHLSGGVQVVQYFFRLRAGLLDILSGLCERLRLEHHRVDDSLKIAQLAAVLIKHSAGFLRDLVTAVQALSQSFCARG